ncbi:MAG: hypothetical protein HYY20_06580 [Candidatus Tectomicrobia bacterium]|uniref:Uncharacterized protein n=1 Tax=Tectimicrobiota bacterium TaxID=2528274 RepID=A0A932CN96_UNCTE|nr:hypothetical protein [Candidatus Tectomicrobia bacterium]
MRTSDGLAAESDNTPMPKRVIHSHDFPGGHHPSILREAVKLKVKEKQTNPKVAFTVEIRSLTGHQFPDT